MYLHTKLKGPNYWLVWINIQFWVKKFRAMKTVPFQTRAQLYGTSFLSCSWGPDRLGGDCLLDGISDYPLLGLLPHFLHHCYWDLSALIHTESHSATLHQLQGLSFWKPLWLAKVCLMARWESEEPQPLLALFRALSWLLFHHRTYVATCLK